MSSSAYNDDGIFIQRKTLIDADWQIIYGVLKSHTKVCSFVRACRKHIRHEPNHLDAELHQFGEACKEGILILSAKEIKVV